MRYLEMFILTDSSLAYPNTPIKVVPQPSLRYLA